MNKNRILSNLLATTMICGALGMAAPAYAQDAEDQTGASAGPVEGQDPDVSSDADPDADEEGDIVVTGSRIPQPNLSAVSPVTVVNSQEVKLQGTTRTEDLINSLPQAFAEQGGNLANGASGTATVNLRGLGSERTLVLINGRRLVPGDPFSSAADINVIPTAMIDRVDVLTGGASSVYGSDAIAGVVNFIMDTDFEGIRLDGQYSFYNHDNNSPHLKDGPNGLIARNFGFPGGTVADGGTVDLNVVIGAGFDDGRGNVVAYAGYRKLDAVTQDKRDFSACASQARTPAQLSGANANLPGAFCGGSATSANGTIIAYDGGTSTFFQIGPNRTLIGGFSPYNFAPTNYFQRPDERYTFGFFANYEISESLRPYLEGMFMDDRTLAQIAPSGDFGNTFFINCGSPAAPRAVAPGVGNPLLSQQQRNILCDTENLLTDAAGNTAVTDAAQNPPIVRPPAVFIDPTTGLPYTRGFAQILRRNVEGGGRIDDLQHTNFRVVAGMRGDLSSVWSYDAYYQFGQTNYADTYLNDFSVTRLTRAIDIIQDPRPGLPTTGQPICRSAVDGTDPNCVPWDIFAVGQVNPAALAYLQTPGFQRGNTKQSVVSGSITGQLGEYGVKLPWANDGVGIALGVEYRKDSLELETDVAFQTGDLAGQGAPTLPSSGAFDVREAFVEARIPLVEESFFYNLSLELGYRYSDYDLKGADRGFSTDTYKLAAHFAPIRDVRFRASYNRAVRAPNIQELFATQRVALNGNGDPCAGDFIAGNDTPAPSAPLAACQAMGVSAAQYGSIVGNPAGQYNGLIGGNADLIPETATTKSVGIVLEPRFLPRFALTVDWFDIKVKDAIQQIGQDTILDVCVQTLDPQFCGLVRRDQFGSLWRTSNGFVIDLDQNIGAFSTRGIDLSASYSMEIGSMGGLSFSIVGTWLDKLVTDPGISEKFDCAGLYGLRCGTPNPEWRHKARISYTHPDGYGLSFQWRHFGGVTLDRASDVATLQGAFAPFNEKIPQINYFDLTGTFRVGDHFNFRLGVNNLLDKDPPIIGANGTSSVINACTAVLCSGNTFPNVYDALGRYIFAGVTLDF
jgi:iron complex outermembrane receptor protein